MVRMVSVVAVKKSAYLARSASRHAHSKTMPLVTQGTSTAKCAVPASPDNPSTATNSNRQLMTTKSKLRYLFLPETGN